MEMVRRNRGLVLVLVAGVLLLAACRQGENAAAPSDGTATTAVAVSSTTTTKAIIRTTVTTNSTLRFPPEATGVRQGDQLFGVFVAVERTTSAPELARAKEDLRSVGYRVAPGATDINCDQGARQALGLTPGVDYFVEAVYFRTRREAQQFVEAFQPGVVGTAAVTAYCRD
jgi:hypothetical protein